MTSYIILHNDINVKGYTTGEDPNTWVTLVGNPVSVIKLHSEKNII